MTTNKFGHSQTQVDDKIFVFGGAFPGSQQGPTLTNQLLKYNGTRTLFLTNITEGLNQYEEITSQSVPMARNFHSAVACDSRLIIFGGKANGYANDLHSYDTLNNAWSDIVTTGNRYRPSPRYGHTAVVYEQKMFVFGGYDHEGFCCNDLYTLDIKSSQWLPIQPLRTKKIEARFHHTAEIDASTGLMTVIGGCSNNRQVHDSVIQINLNTYHVTECPKLPTGRFGHVSYQVDGIIHVVGGCDFTQDFPSGYSLTNDWTPIEKSLGEDCVFASAVYHNNDVMAVGGVAKNGPPSRSNQTNTVYDDYLEELGDAVLNILQFLRPMDLVSIILTSKNWTFAMYATRKIQFCTHNADNVLWETHFNDQMKEQKYAVVRNKYAQQIETIKNTESTDKYKKAIDFMYQCYKQNIEEASSEMKKFILQHAWTRSTKEVYGIPKDPYYLHLIPDYDKLFPHQHSGSNYIKVMIVGDGAVGKTSMLITYTSDVFPTDYIPTVFDNYTANVLVGEKSIGMGLWDTAGPEEYDRIRPFSYPGTEVFLLVFSVVNPASFKNVVTKWLPEIRQHCPEVPVLLCGAKIDLRKDPDCLQRLQDKGLNIVTYEEGEYMAQQCGCIGYVENSSKTQTGLKNTFDSVIRCAGSYRRKQKKNNCKPQ